MNIVFDNNSFYQEESEEINYNQCYEDSFENKNIALLFNDGHNLFYDDSSYEQKNYLTEENKDDKFNGEFGLDEDKKSKTEITIFEKTRDTETKGKDKKSKFKNEKESETNFNQEKHNENFIKEEKSINDINSSNNKKIFNITKEYERKILKGRKRKFNFGAKGKHDKFCHDNIVRKVKTKLFEIILFFINLSITPIEKENKKNSKKKVFYKPLLVKIDQEIIKTINVEDNLKLLESKLKDIFSNKTSIKYKHHDLDRNKKIIDEIYEEKIQKKTISILNKTFEQCLDHINGINYDEELEGLEFRYQNILKGLRLNGNSEDYISEFKYMVKNFKSFYSNKKARKKKE